MFEKLVLSLKDFPEMMELRPIIIDDQNIIQGGNMRYRALKELGYKEIPDSWVKKGKELTPEQWKEFVVKDNLSYGEWDMDALAADYDLEQLEGWGFDCPDLYETHDPKKIQDDNYKIPEQIETDIKLGDVFTVGRHKLVCGDVTKKEYVDLLMKDKEADLLLTDPPYNVNYGEKVHQANIANDNLPDTAFYNFLFDFYKRMLAVMKSGASYYIFHADSEGYNFRKALHDNGVDIRQCLVWVKNTLVLGRQDYHWRHEPILYGWKPGAPHYFINDRTQTTVIDEEIDVKKMKRDELLQLLAEIMSEKNPTSVIYHDRPSSSELHPTMKPVPLVGYLMQNSSKLNDIVVDPFIGSGTTMVAAHQLRRRCFAMEIDPGYCEITIDRMQKLDPEIQVTRNGKPYERIAQLSEDVGNSR